VSLFVTHRHIERYEFRRQLQSNEKDSTMDGILGEIHKVFSDPAFDFIASTAISIVLAQKASNFKKN
jgi:hypothetical protein